MLPRKQFEYRFETITFQNGQTWDQQILARLNELGKAGWRVCSLPLVPRLTASEDSLKVLLIRTAHKPGDEHLALVGYDDDFEDNDVEDDFEDY